MMPHPIRVRACSRSHLVHAIVSLYERAQPKASGGMMPPPIRAWVCSQSYLLRAAGSFNKRTQLEASGGLNPQAFSRPGLFSKLPCTRGCKSLRTSATEGKRRHDAAPNSRLGLCAKLPCTRGREFPQTSAAEGKRPARERQASSSRSRQRDCSRVQPAAARRRSTMLCFSRLRKQR